MYDNVDLRLSREKANIDLLEEVPVYLSNITESYNEDWGISISGYADSLKVRVNERNVKIVGSSIAKYWLGNNIKGLFRGDMERAIEKISDHLHLPFQNANVTRIDLAANFVVNYDESLYYPYLGQAQFYNRMEAPNGIYYQNSTRQLIFYGKLKEQKDKFQVIPDYYQDKKMLRYEMRLKKRLPKQLNRPEVLASDLYDEVSYMALLDLWEREYKRINKINTILSNMQPTGSTKIFLECLALIGLGEIGYNNAYQQIKEWQKKGDIDKKQASDLRKKLKDLYVKPNLTEASEMIKELDQKVAEAVLHYR